MGDGALLRIERATAADVEGIMMVERHCFGRIWTRQQYLNEILGSRHTYPAVAKVDGLVVAFGSLTCVGDQGYIPTLGVLSDYRRQGLASLVLAALLRAAVAMGGSEVVLEVRVRNVAARRLYERHGFQSIATRPNYYEEPPDDAIVMRWRPEEAPGP